MKYILISLFALIFLASCITSAQTIGSEKPNTTPVEKLLNPDGTINTHTGFTGSVDIQGFKMLAGSNGVPRFVLEGANTAASPGDTVWDDHFWSPGLNGTPVSAAFVGSDLYVSGSFSAAGAIAVSGLAKWNGTAWDSVPGFAALGRYAGVLTVQGTNLYIATTTPNNDYTADIWKWNGSSWSLLGTMSSSSCCIITSVTALIVIGTDLYVGSGFDRAAGIPANGIAKWNGSSWDSLGAGLTLPPFGPAQASAFATDGSTLYVGGGFTMAGATPARHIAKWNGSSWDSLGGGINTSVNTLAMIGTDLYAGGLFDSAGNTKVHNIAKWNGASWDSLGNGITGIHEGYNPHVRSLAVIGSDLYAGGTFDSAGYVQATCVAKWDGSNWSALGAGASAFVYCLTAGGTDLYVGEDGYPYPRDEKKFMQKWNGSTWSALYSPGSYHGLNGPVYALAMIGTDVYAAGNFFKAGSVNVNSIAKWNGTSWDSLGSGITGFGGGFPGTVRALAVSGSNLYAAGYFFNAGGVNANCVAKWNGTNWDSLGSGMGYNVYALATVGTDLYAGGGFTMAGGIPASGIAKWNGTTWSALGSGVSGGTEPVVYALAASGNDLYVGGGFTTAGGMSAGGIAKWNGTSWSALGSGVSGSFATRVRALRVVGLNLYASGNFLFAGGVGVFNIARWDGSSWSALGPGLTFDEPRAIVGYDNDLYACGYYISRWNGISWTTVGTAYHGWYGTYAAVYPKGRLYVGGYFELLGEGFNPFVKTPSFNFGFRDTPSPSFSTVSNALNIGLRDTGATYLDSIIVSDTSISPLMIVSVASNNGTFVVSPSGGAVPGFGLKKFYVSFTPHALGPHAAHIVFTHDGPGSPDTVTATGTGVAPLFSVTPTTISFGTVTPGSTKQDSLMVKNYGTSALIITSISSSDLELTINPTSATIAVSDSQKFYVTLSPVLPYVNKTDTIVFIHNLNATDKVIVTANGIMTDTVQGGWNLLSVPVIVSDYARTSVYPTSSSAFAFQSSYRQRDTLRNGEGYWVKFSSSQAIQYVGLPVSPETINVSNNWNIIGSISSPIPVSNITSIPGGIVTTNFFGYNGGYFISDSILPGKANWVKVSQAGKLVLASSGIAPAANRINIIPTSETPPPPPIAPDIETSNLKPETFGLNQNYPNPFNPSTVIRYQLPVASYVAVKVYDVLGREIVSLVDEVQDAGFKSVEWNAGNIPSGVYFYKLQAGSFTSVQKMVLLK